MIALTRRAVLPESRLAYAGLLHYVRKRGFPPFLRGPFVRQRVAIETSAEQDVLGTS